MRNRSVATVIILYIITCGIYGLYWLAVTQDDLNQTDGETGTSGGTAVLLSIVTCGIYRIYWMYQIGRRVGRMSNNDSLNVLNLVLSLFGFDVIGMAITQNDINQIATR